MPFGVLKEPWSCSTNNWEGTRLFDIEMYSILIYILLFTVNTFLGYWKRQHSFSDFQNIWIAYIGNFATYDTHMCCLSYENHMKNICVSYAYLIIWVSYVANHMRIIWTSICWSYAANVVLIWFALHMRPIWKFCMRIICNWSVLAIYLFINLKYYVFHPIHDLLALLWTCWWDHQIIRR